jgi:hypothetical protein
LFLLISIYSFSLLFTIFYPYFLFVGYFVEGSQREALMGVLTAPEQATQLTINEAMNQAFGTSSEEDEGKEDEGEEVNEEETDGVSNTTIGSCF